jgi:hypothetical protein
MILHQFQDLIGFHPWEIEPFVASVPASLAQSAVAKNKRPRTPIEIPNLGEIFVFFLLTHLLFVLDKLVTF